MNDILEISNFCSVLDDSNNNSHVNNDKKHPNSSFNVFHNLTDLDIPNFIVETVSLGSTFSHTTHMNKSIALDIVKIFENFFNRNYSLPNDFKQYVRFNVNDELNSSFESIHFAIRYESIR